MIQEGKELLILNEAPPKKQNENEHSDLNASIVQEESSKSMSKKKEERVIDVLAEVNEMEVEEAVPKIPTKFSKDGNTQYIPTSIPGVYKESAVRVEKRAQQKSQKEVTEKQLSELKKQLEASLPEKPKPVPPTEVSSKPSEPIVKPSEPASKPSESAVKQNMKPTPASTQKSAPASTQKPAPVQKSAPAPKYAKPLQDDDNEISY